MKKYVVGDEVLIIKGPFKGAKGQITHIYYFSNMNDIYCLSNVIGASRPLPSEDVPHQQEGVLYAIQEEVVPFSELARTIYL